MPLHYVRQCTREEYEPIQPFLVQAIRFGIDIVFCCSSGVILSRFHAVAVKLTTPSWKTKLPSTERGREEMPGRGREPGWGRGGEAGRRRRGGMGQEGEAEGGWLFSVLSILSGAKQLASERSEDR